MNTPIAKPRYYLIPSGKTEAFDQISGAQGPFASRSEALSALRREFLALPKKARRALAKAPPKLFRFSPEGHSIELLYTWEEVLSRHEEKRQPKLEAHWLPAEIIVEPHQVLDPRNGETINQRLEWHFFEASHLGRRELPATPETLKRFLAAGLSPNYAAAKIDLGSLEVSRQEQQLDLFRPESQSQTTTDPLDAF